MKSRILAGASFGLMAAMIGAMGFASSETALASQDAPPAITVLVANYSQASPAILAAAEREAGRILGQAGLRASWLECPVTIHSWPKTLVRKRPQTTGLRLRILPAPVLDKFQDTCLWLCHPSGSRQRLLRVRVEAGAEGRCRVRAPDYSGLRHRPRTRPLAAGLE